MISIESSQASGSAASGVSDPGAASALTNPQVRHAGKRRGGRPDDLTAGGEWPSTGAWRPRRGPRPPQQRRHDRASGGLAHRGAIASVLKAPSTLHEHDQLRLVGKAGHANAAAAKLFIAAAGRPDALGVGSPLVGALPPLFSVAKRLRPPPGSSSAAIF
jgi:hypothetical protein